VVDRLARIHAQAPLRFFGAWKGMEPCRVGI
jgi:hypothetical protein